MILQGFNPVMTTYEKEVVSIVGEWWQSNMRGNKDGQGWNTFPPAYKVLIPKGFINYAYDTAPNNQSFQALDGAYDSVYKTFRYLGSQYSLATDYTQYNNRALYIVHYAIGSTSLQSDWNPDGPGQLYANFVQYMTNAVNNILSMGKIPRIISYIGIGGEQDAQVGIVAGQMKTLLNSFINRLRNEPFLKQYCVGGTSVNIQIGLMGTWSTTQNVAYPQRRLLIRADQQAVANEGVNIQTFETEDLASVVGDEIHRTTDAHITIGHRIFQGIKDIT